MMRNLRAPCGPFVWHVVAPDVELVPDALRGEQRGEPASMLERAGRVLPRALSDHEQQSDLRAEPLEMIAVEPGDVVGRVVEVGLVAALAPAHDRDVVDAREAEREREEVGSAEREVRG